MAPDHRQRRALTGSVDLSGKADCQRRGEVRVLFAFDPCRSAILLTGGDKSGDWQAWYPRAIPHAEELYAEYPKEREAEEGR
jgi:hypothetical protein